MEEAQQATQNNAAVEINRRKALIESRERQEGADKLHRANVPAQDKPRQPTIHPTRMKLAEYDRQEWVVNAEITHTIEDLTNPAYWAHMAQQMNPYDHIEVRSEDGTWIAELIVIEVGLTWAKTILRGQYSTVPKGEAIQDTDKHEVRWRGAQHRFAVVRKSDDSVIRQNFQTKDEAAAWMKEHERTVV